MCQFSVGVGSVYFGAGSGLRAESGEQGAEEQRAESRGQGAESREQRAESKGQGAEGINQR